MNGKLAKRLRYAADCTGNRKSDADSELKFQRKLSKREPNFAQASLRKRFIRRLVKDYKATPFHRRDVHQESHSFVLQVKHGNATRRFPA